MKYIIVFICTFLFSCSKHDEINRKAKISANYIQIIALKEGVIDFYQSKGGFPNDLYALQDPSYSKRWIEIPADQWGQEFQFIKINDKTAKIISLGEDGITSKDDVIVYINVDEAP